MAKKNGLADSIKKMQGKARRKYVESLTPEQQQQLREAIEVLRAMPVIERPSHRQIAELVAAEFGKPVTDGTIRNWINQGV